MKYRKLGNTEIELSVVGLGTMTWGEQNTETEAHEQIDYALSKGVNLVDTAEMYPVPPKADTAGLTESYIGSWLSLSNRRHEIFLATKAVGPTRTPGRPGHIRPGKAKLDKANLREALEQSLTRLNTDYVDLYQLHWPDRSTNMFGELAYPWVEDEESVSIHETLEALNDFVQEGKVRYIGLSNETPWGVSQFIKFAEMHNLPRVVTIQNPYNLLNRTFEHGLSEFSHRERVGLLAYSPLAMGMLSGKYLNGARPDGARLTVYERFTRYNSLLCEAATEGYVALARKHSIPPATMALAFINQQPFVTSNIIGATNLKQLRENIESVNITLSNDIIDEINTIHRQYQNPAP
ncbi:NADP(H)-dependent aldo-keto reductase [Paenalcaligenes niemegkensis]|uniref:NADP(H)-dependent aldo-keto reductase n=1 Tax=Paenalcaligenes niemegkensis TaxID=2895469 RepID=UPI001EE78315|nr:NADP(H)-dependent aldo-keto reductase [Paenalcaligenes niemegkensis]MCQ9616505.1 NADP(H)-dependent aldo-keto reductase [Paenalcaligenes niemegkensis]